MLRAATATLLRDAMDALLLAVNSGRQKLYVWDVEHDAGMNFRLTDVYARRVYRDGTVHEAQAVPVSAATRRISSMSRA